MQILKTEHELNQERTKERDNSIARLRDEYQNSKLTWKKEVMASSTNHHCSAKERAGTVIFFENHLLLNLYIRFLINFFF